MVLGVVKSAREVDLAREALAQLVLFIVLVVLDADFALAGAGSGRLGSHGGSVLELLLGR